jgi:hypothetical protein
MNAATALSSGRIAVDKPAQRQPDYRTEVLPLGAALLRVRANLSFATPGHRGGRGFGAGRRGGT